MAESALVVRLGGLAAMVGGLLWSVKVLIGTASAPRSYWIRIRRGGCGIPRMGHIGNFREHLRSAAR